MQYARPGSARVTGPGTGQLRSLTAGILQAQSATEVARQYCCDMHLRHHWDVVAFENDYFDVADEAVMREFWAAVAQLYMHGTPCMLMEITAKHHW